MRDIRTARAALVIRTPLPRISRAVQHLDPLRMRLYRWFILWQRPLAERERVLAQYIGSDQQCRKGRRGSCK